MGVFDETLFRLVPAVYRELSAALDASDSGARRPPAPAFLRFGSWVGGDRDGNPHITAQVTRETMLIQSEHILRGLEAACTRIGTGLTADSATTPPDGRFLNRLRVARETVGGRAAAIGARSPEEPYREFLLLVAERIGATRHADLSLAYAGPDELVEDLLGRSGCARGCRSSRARRMESCRSSSGRRRRLAFISRISRYVSTAACTATRSPKSPRAVRAHPRPRRSSPPCAPSRSCSNGSARASVIATW